MQHSPSSPPRNSHTSQSDLASSTENDISREDASSATTRQIETLDNGLTLIEIFQPWLRTANLTLLVKTGSRFEKPKENGLTHFLEHMTFRGTSSHPSAFELNKAFERLGANINASTTPDSTEYSVSLPAQSFVTASSLLCGMITKPNFNEIDTERKIISEEILEDFDENRRCIDIDQLSRQRVWAGNALGASITGSIENVMNFEYPDLNRWYNENYVAGNMILCVSGDISAPSIRKHLRDIWRPLRAGERKTVHPFAVDQAHKDMSKYLHAHKPGSQTQVRLAFRTPGLLHADYPVVEILLRLIDDGMSTPLHRRIFEDLALAYNIGAELEAYEDTGVLNIDAQASHENISAIVDEALKIILELRRGIIDEEDLKKALSRAIWDLESLPDFPGAMNSWYGEQALYRPPISPMEMARRVSRISADDITKTANAIFSYSNFYLTTVGPFSARQQARLKEFTRQHYWQTATSRG